MTSITLSRPEISFFSNPEIALEIPRFVTFRKRQSLDHALVHFEGYRDPFLYRGEAATTTYDVVFRYSGQEHNRLKEMSDFLDQATTRADGRVAIRTNFGQFPGLDPYLVVFIPEWRVDPLGGHAWDINFTAHQVHHSIEV